MTERPWPTDPLGATAEAEWRRRLGDVSMLDLRSDGGFDRLLVVAAHPDDETLGAGGLIHTVARFGWAVQVVVASAGEASHPASPRHTAQSLARVRRAEAAQAVSALAKEAGLLLRDYPDGRIAQHEADLVADLVRLIGTERGRTLVAAPWRGDRHPDHEAAGRAAALACQRTDSGLLEYPVWLWHWGDVADAPWPQLRALPLSDGAHHAKRAAVRAYASQTAPLSPEAGDEAVLPGPVLERFDRHTEVFVQAPPAPDDTFERLHADNDDPWQTATSDYEIAKRAATCQALPRPRYGRVLDIGCSIGLLTAQLAQRAEHVVAVDASASALRRAAQCVAEPNVEFRRLDVPHDWPEGSFDLIVVSEVGYYLSPTRLQRLVAAVRACLLPGGVVALCHWRHEIAGWPLDAAAVHAAFSAGLQPHLFVVSSRPTPEYLLEVYANGHAS